jgi:hypothetical protein
MSWAETIILAAIATIVVFILHLFLHFRKYTKEKPMARVRQQDDNLPAPVKHQPRVAEEQGAIPTGLSPVSGTSMNDVLELRNQDQALAQLTTHYEDMAKEPWSIKAGEWASGLIPQTRIRAYALVLGFMMNPPAVGGAQRGISGRETLWFLNVGNQKITAASEDACKKLHTKINELYFETIAKHRSDTLSGITALAKTDTPILFDAATKMHAVCCGQTQVWFETQEAAEEMRNVLNIAFKPIFDSERRRILDEIVDEIE